ncbi:MAG: hypothetical protein QME87_14465 [Bacillota bacterium]|nr:hypothetical protein [Bacillota bacterium]
MLYVGIDWAEKAHRVCIRDDEKIHAELEVPNSAEGAADLLKKIATIEPDVRQHTAHRPQAAGAEWSQRP